MASSTVSDDVAAPPVGAATRARWLAAVAPLAVVVAVSALFGAGLFSGAFAAVSDLADAGAVVRWAAPVTTVLGHLASAVALGALLTAAALLGPGRAQRTALTTAGVAAGAWALAGVAGLVLQYAEISARPFGATDFGPGLWQFVTEIPVGSAGLRVVLLAAVTAGLALAVRGGVGALVVAVLPLAALAYQASTGHAAGAASHTLAVGAMYLHLVGAALWVGGLAAIAVLVVTERGSDDDRPPAWVTALPRFSVVAAWCLVIVGYSGVVSAWIRVGALGDLRTGYGVLVLAKALLLGVLGIVGLMHRRRVIGHLADGQPARCRLFARLAAVELVIMGAVMGVAVALGDSAPPVPDVVPDEASPAYQLTGAPLPPELTGERWFTQ